MRDPHLSCQRDEIKMRDYKNRRVTPSKRVTSPNWGSPPPCKQALRTNTRVWKNSLCLYKTKMIEKKKRRVFIYLFIYCYLLVYFIFNFISIHFLPLTFSVNHWCTVRAGCYAPDSTPVILFYPCIRASSSGSRLF